ncbi:hypothetical protein AMR41_29485 [Hapalosiphon sp. MRB220]|nr:hypothetical protein AMR41_29485 [Hapalosiphon sp. MRB220]
MKINGIAFPLALDPSKGNLLLASDADLIQGHILSYLQTQPFERVMVPSYGMKDYLFDTISDMSVITSDIEAGLKSYVPDAEFQVTGSINDQGEALISVYWSYKDEEQATITVTL